MPTPHSRPSREGGRSSFSGSFRAGPARGGRPSTSPRPAGDKKFNSSKPFARPAGARPFGAKPAFGGKPTSSYAGSKPAYGASRPSYGAKPEGARSFGGKPSFGGSRAPFNGSRSFGAGRRPFGGGRSSGGSRGKQGGRFEKIDSSKFVRKAEYQEAKPYVSKHTFADFPFDAKLHAAIAKKGFEHPMPIQDQTIAITLTGKDVMGLANTGTGKTAAFLLPLIQKVLKDRKEKVLILAPTRELALQIEKEFIDFSRTLGIFSVSCVGGMPIVRQMRELKRGVSFVIGTPGRVKDLIDRKALVLSNFRSAVLDEADRMLDMGFRDDMEEILKLMPADRQTLFFSATMSPDIKVLTQKFLKNPELVSVVNRDTSKNVDQDIIRIKDKNSQIDQLHDVLIKEGSDKVLIFRETKRDVDRLEKELKDRGFKVGAIHGDKRNRERIRVLEDFKRDIINVLIATDVAARGLDIPDVTHVINYDVPQTYDTYVHRIGRTGRGNKTGKAITFVK